MRRWLLVWRGLAFGGSVMASLVGIGALLRDPGDSLCWGLTLLALTALAMTMAEWTAEDGRALDRWLAERRDAHDR